MAQLRVVGRGPWAHQVHVIGFPPGSELRLPAARVALLLRGSPPGVFEISDLGDLVEVLLAEGQIR